MVCVGMCVYCVRASGCVCLSGLVCACDGVRVSVCVRVFLVIRFLFTLITGVTMSSHILCYGVCH